MDARNWTEPTSIDDARKRIDELVIELKDLEYQLSSRNRVDHSGRRLNGIEYGQWRDRARYVQLIKQKELMRLKQWMRSNVSLASIDTERTLFVAYTLLKHQFNFLSDTDRAIFKSIHNHLREIGIINSHGHLLEEWKRRAKQ